ncbi:porin family protein [Marivirga atlantica]|jgi:hypothetical protein|uniref:PorT family protein n=1 Tax=Marivirga atlantica TaxID=1548457 RepID=A0A937DDK2_9BACT|nr:porin family protein [Marivirga atlantica]MBL0764312.1 PorT family protein [Marivirga atlantica]
MKSIRTLYIFLFLTFSSGSMYAQEHFIGVKGGVSIPFVDFNDFALETNYSQYIFAAPYAAISYRHMSTPKIGVQFDLAYAQKGWGQNLIVEQQVANTIKNTIDYIELPVYLHWAILGDRKFNIGINGGVYAAYAISASRQIVNLTALEQSVAEYNIETDNRTDFGLMLGINVSYDFSFGEIQLEGSYKPGFANILPVSHIKKENPIVSSNQSPTFTINYLIPLSKFKKE